MRPPLNAGENRAQCRLRATRRWASMRPPLNAGENATFFSARFGVVGRFNEAPAERGGKLVGCTDHSRPARRLQ